MRLVVLRTFSVLRNSSLELGRAHLRRGLGVYGRSHSALLNTWLPLSHFSSRTRALGAAAVTLAVVGAGIFFPFISRSREVLWGKQQIRCDLLALQSCFSHSTNGACCASCWELVKILLCLSRRKWKSSVSRDEKVIRSLKELIFFSWFHDCRINHFHFTCTYIWKKSSEYFVSFVIKSSFIKCLWYSFWNSQLYGKLW